MKNIVITGSTRGIGYGLADHFLRSGQQVMISGRTPASVDRALEQLSRTHSRERMVGCPCNVLEFKQLEALWSCAQSHFSKVDIWINNAGLGQGAAPFWELEEQQIERIVTTNLLGVMYGARVALRGMIRQGSGALYNMEGLGSDGRIVAGLTAYSTTKRGVRYLTRALAQEVTGTGVIVGALSPGMVATDLLLERYQGRDPAEWENTRKIFNILADKVETVAPFLVDKVLGNHQNGARIVWLTAPKIAWRFMTAPLRNRDVLTDYDQSGG